MKSFSPRKVVRLPNFDYSAIHYYFITICTHEKKCIFGMGDRLTDMGTTAYQDMMEIPFHYEGVKIDKFVVMPNHIHMILVLEGERKQRPTINHVIALYKAGVSRKIRNKYPGRNIWQRSFYEHVIRNHKDYENIWNYIEYNPVKWEEDRFFSSER